MGHDAERLVAVGVDLCAAAEFGGRTAAFFALAFTDAERAWCGGDAARYARCWAVKEAAVKALTGAGVGGVMAAQIEADPEAGAARVVSRRGESVGDPAVLGLRLRAAASEGTEGTALAVVTAVARTGEG